MNIENCDTIHHLIFRMWERVGLHLSEMRLKMNWWRSELCDTYTGLFIEIYCV